MTAVAIRPMTAADTPAVPAIHQAGPAVLAVPSRAVYGRGVGRMLVDALIASAGQAGIWAIQSGNLPENTPSPALHRAAGFRTVGLRERACRQVPQGNRARDVVLVERRSPLGT